MKLLTKLVMPLAGLLAMGTTANSAQADTPSQYWSACRNDALLAANSCFVHSSGYADDVMCNIGLNADLVSCDIQFARNVWN